MKKLWKFTFAVLLAVLVVAALALVACNPNDNPQLPQTPDGGGTGSDAKTTYTVTFDANGGRFADNAEKQTNQVESGSKLTAPVSPERTNYTFAGWSKNKNGSDMWKFDTDTVTANTTLYAKWNQTSAVVLSVDGASMDGATIFMFVEHDVDSVPLTDKVVCSDDSTWKLYYDKMGQQPIPTKVAAQMNGFLTKGANVFYILVSSQNGTQENLYELTVYRSYEVPVCYYNVDHLIYTDSCYTGHEYVANYQPNIEGYTFNYWTNGGSQYKTETIWGELNLVANKTANKYDVTFAVNQGNALSEQDQSKTVTYDSAFKLPVPTRTGYSFVGWYSGSTQITAGNGNGLLPWNIAYDVQLQAHWQANEYELTVRASNAKAGTVSGTGTYAYDSSVTLTAETNSGYTFVGWFDGDDKISDQLTFNYTMGLAKTITAKWSKVTLTVNNSSAGSVQQLSEKYKVGDEVQITAVTKPGYTFVGWYKEDQQISTDLQCTITMTDSDVTYTAKWSKVTLTVNDSSAGSVQQLTEKYKVGDEVQITAVTKPGYTFVGWYKEDQQISTDLQCTITMTDSDVTYTAHFIKTVVKTAVNNSAAGSVTPLDGAYALGQNVVVTATTNSGYTFVGWYKEDQQISTDLQCTITMTDSDITYTAHFIKTIVKTAVNNSAAGSVTPLDGAYALGQEVVVTATTNSGYTFVGWYKEDQQISTDLQCTITMTDSDVTYTAKWSKVTLTVNNSSAGSVQQLTKKYKVDDEVQITAVTKLGYTFVGWYKEDQQISTDLQCTITMTDSDITYTAHFIKTVVKTAVNNSAAGSVTPLDGAYALGQEVVVTATTNSGYTFVGWYKEDQQISTDLQCTITMTDSDVTYTAKWSKVTLTVNNSSAGSVQQLTKKYKVGEEVQITAVTKPGYTFVGWYKEDQQISTDLQCTITMTDSDVTYTAKWSKVTLTVNNSSAGSVQQLTEKYKVGDEVQITATTNLGYTFVGWYKEDQQISTDLQCTITMTDSDVTYTAKWEPILYNLTFNYDSNIGDFDGDKPTKYTIEGLTLPQLVGKNGNGHFGIEWRDEAGKIYTNEIPQGTTGDLTLTLTKWVGIHTWGSDGKCIYCKLLKEPYSEVDGEVKPYTMSDGKIVFGTYPQSKVEDTALQSMLNAEIQNKLPSSDNANGWTDYGYYISGEVQSYMWYVDVNYQNEKYRGVYFTSYRPYYTTSSSSTGNTCQYENGYNSYTIYWFKWEPITWRILSQDEDKLLVMADLIIDSQQYYHEYSGTRTIDGKTVYPNNYKESDIRKWLNADFYNAAFDELSKDFIIQTEVDNSASTTSSSNNQYACENTLDNVFLLSYKDVLNTSYGFKSSNSAYDTYRQLKTTDYAQCQGAYTATGSYQDFGCWWLRSPQGTYSDEAYGVNCGSNVDYGSNVNYTSSGVVPALQIQL